MTVGYRRNDGTDLDDFFEPLQSGDSKAAEVGFRDENGNDLRDRYAPHSVGAKPGNNAGFRKGDGADLRHIFCAKGERLEFSFDIVHGFCGETDDVAGTCTATGSVTAVPTGGTPPYSYSFSIIDGPASMSVTDDTADMSHTGEEPSGHETTVRCTVTDANGVQVTDDAVWQCSHLV